MSDTLLFFLMIIAGFALAPMIFQGIMLFAAMAISLMVTPIYWACRKVFGNNWRDNSDE